MIAARNPISRNARWRHPVHLVIEILVPLIPAISAGAYPASDHVPRISLTKVSQIRALTEKQAKLKSPIHLVGVITYHAPEYGVTFFQDETAGIFVWPEQTDALLSAGSLVEIDGNTTAGDFAPSIEHARIRVIGRSRLPVATRKHLDTLLTGSDDSQWVGIEGIVHSVSREDHLPPDMRRGPPQLVLGIASGNNLFKARIREFDRNSDYRELVDSSIVVKGACGTLFNDKRQLVGVQLFVPSIESVSVTRPAPNGAYGLPLLPTNSLMQFNPATAGGHRMRIEGVVTLSKPGKWIFVQDASGGVLVETAQKTQAQAGELVDAVGFPMAGRYAPILQDGGFRVLGPGRLPAPRELDARSGASGRHDAELVTIYGRLLDQSERGGNRVFTMQRDNFTFTGVLDAKAANTEVISIRNGSLLRMSGVWSVETDEYRRPTAYRVLLHSAPDILVLQRPSWWTVPRILGVLAVLGGLILIGTLWVAALRQRVRERTETLRATLEATADGILVMNADGQVTSYNQKFIEAWRIPNFPDPLTGSNKALPLEFLSEQLSNPTAFLNGKQQLGHDACAIQSDDVLETKDGRSFEQHSEPQVVKGSEVGRVWGFRDITERRRAQERLAARTTELDKANVEIRRLNDQLRAENTRMSAELEVTRRLQQMIQPRDEDLRRIPDLDISGFMEPASEVGGDYYDVISEAGRVVFSIGDVTGHGLESGVLAIMVQTAVRTLLASGHYDSGTFFEVLNRVIYDNAHRMNCNRNLTFSVLHYQNSVATISGQHEELIVVRNNGELERHDTIDLGFPIGLERDISSLIAERKVPLASGDVMVLYTDGITEAVDSSGEGFGIKQLSEAVRHNHHQPAACIREAVLSNFRRHVNGLPPVDDMTLLVIKVR
jgi:serine phosphatase RsbU (regulator of sigma subunit)/PAS domain-containing protein